MAIAPARWWIVGLAGALWMLLGLFFLANAFHGGVRVWPGWFALALLPDGLLSLAGAFRRPGKGGRLRLLRAAAFLSVAAVITATAGRAELAIGLLVSGFLIIEATARFAGAWRERFDGWRGAILLAMVELLLGVWTLLAYPADGVVGSDVSLLVMNSATCLCMLAARLRRMPPGGDRGGVEGPVAPSASRGTDRG